MCWNLFRFRVACGEIPAVADSSAVHERKPSASHSHNINESVYSAGARGRGAGVRRAEVNVASRMREFLQGDARDVSASYAEVNVGALQRRQRDRESYDSASDVTEQVPMGATRVSDVMTHERGAIASPLPVNGGVGATRDTSCDGEAVSSESVKVNGSHNGCGKMRRQYEKCKNDAKTISSSKSKVHEHFIKCLRFQTIVSMTSMATQASKRR